MSTRRLLLFFLTIVVEPRDAAAQLYIIDSCPPSWGAMIASGEGSHMRISQPGLVLAIVLLVAGPAYAADYYGAIAYSPTTRAHGWAKDHPSRQAAERASLSGCAQHAADCSAVLWF